MQKPPTTSEKVSTPPDGLLFPLIDLSVAGWVTYLQKEKGARPAAGLAPRPKTTRRALRRRTGTYVRLTAAAFAGLQCECAAAARPAAAGRLSGMTIELKKCVIFYA